jgi:hypothetical protein
MNDNITDAKTRNSENARDAGKAMLAFVQTQEPSAGDLESVISQSPQEFLVDLLADLRHWAIENGLDYEEADRIAQGHYVTELAEATEGAAKGGVA